ncbi:MAG TPA: hypothetical protein VMQ44_01590 [Candidatus Saccharimonadales bacterium]|nr:hypothetical protein [Candidatus Saccharimonadales bacterium]
MNIVRYVYDPSEAKMSYGLFERTTCGNAFYGGGHALHTRDRKVRNLPEKDQTFIYRFGDEEVEETVERYNTGYVQGLGCLTMGVLREQFPTLLKT